MENCVFCQIVKGKKLCFKIYEDDSQIDLAWPRKELTLEKGQKLRKKITLETSST